MNIKILTPEAVIFEGDVESVLLPGTNGEFHIMKNHAAVVSSLTDGKIKLFTDKISEVYASNFTQESDKGTFFSFTMKGGVVEYNNNKGIILCE